MTRSLSELNVTTRASEFMNVSHGIDAWYSLFSLSEYPAQRSKKDADDVDMGVAGTVNLLQNVTLSTQPIGSLDWSPDKQGLCVCTAFDQTVRVLIVTKLNRL